MVIVKVPNRFYRGVIANVQFDNGEGRFEDVELAHKIAKQFGFEVVESNAAVVEKPVAEVKDEPKSEAKPKRTRKKVSDE